MWSAQLSCYLIDQLQFVNTAGRAAATCKLSCTLLTQMTLMVSAAMCWMGCSEISSFDLWTLTCCLSTLLCSVSLAVICQLNSHVLAQLHISASLPLAESLSAEVNLSGSSCWHLGTLHSTSSYTTISWSLHMLLLMKKRIKSMHA